jgi:alkaline phosphatase D
VANIVNEDDAAEAAFSGFVLYDGPALYTLSKGRTANNGNPPEKITIRGEEYDNPRFDAPPVSMLGLRQKDWFKRSLMNSTARWKVWGNSVPVMAFRFDADNVKPGTGNGYLWTDAWDGFPNEREELLSYIKENKISGVVSLTGDRHAHYAGLGAINYDVENPEYVVPEFVCSSISAFVRAPFVKRPMARMDLGHLSGYKPEGSETELCNLNIFMRYGAVAADVMSKTNDLDQAMAASTGSPNPHLLYAENDTHGYGFAKFDNEKVECDIYVIENESWDQVAQPDGPDALRAVRFQVPLWEGGEAPVMSRVGKTLFGPVEHGEPA